MPKPDPRDGAASAPLRRSGPVARLVPPRVAALLAQPALPRPAVALALALSLAACGSPASPSPSTSAGPGASADASPSAGPSGPASPAPSNAASPSVAPSPSFGSTDTEWGTIWDGVPATFPVYEGAAVVEPDEPASLAYDVDVEVATVTTDLQAELETAGLSTIALSGPFEDGSMVIDSSGDSPGCRVRTTIAPLGATTRVTVLYGVGCPAG